MITERTIFLLAEEQHNINSLSRFSALNKFTTAQFFSNFKMNSSQVLTPTFGIPQNLLTSDADPNTIYMTKHGYNVVQVIKITSTEYTTRS